MQVRARVWPLLLGVDTRLGPEEEQEYQELRSAKHRDSAVVECDVQRSLWTFTEGAALWRGPATAVWNRSWRPVSCLAVAISLPLLSESEGRRRWQPAWSAQPDIVIQDNMCNADAS